MIYVILICVALIHVVGIDGEDMCKTKSVTMGRCILIKDCPQLEQVANELINNSELDIYNFTLAYGCGPDTGTGNFRVCCPDSGTLPTDLGIPERLSSIDRTATALVGAKGTSNASRTPLVPITDKSCRPPFIPFDEENCFFFSNSYIGWEESLQMCQSLEATLYVASSPQHFFRVRDYLNENMATDPYWVGVRGRQWKDGREVNSEEWRTGEPNGVDECGLMGYNGTPQSFYLYDFPCSSESLAICHKIISRAP